jgi:hypothetical protein
MAGKLGKLPSPGQLRGKFLAALPQAWDAAVDQGNGIPRPEANAKQAVLAARSLVSLGPQGLEGPEPSGGSAIPGQGSVIGGLSKGLLP